MIGPTRSRIWVRHGRAWFAGLGTALLVAAWPASAQDGRLNLFLFEKSYAALGTPSVIGAPAYYSAVAEPGLLAEAQFVGHVSLHRGLNAQEIQEGRGGTGWNWYITPQFRLRARDVPSGPVQSVSFMPKFTIQWLRSSGGEPIDPMAGMRWITAAHVVIGHHSNGGDTCEFLDEDPTAECALFTPPAAAPGMREAWVEGGNFSTNYIELGAYARRGRLSDDPRSHWLWSIDGGLMFQKHHNVIGFPLPGGAKEDFAALYGTNRLRLDLSGHRVIANAFAVRGWVRTDLFHTGADRFAGSRSYTLESEVFIQRVEDLRDAPRLVRAIPSFIGVGFRWSRGQDYYNVQYVRDINVVQFMVTVDPWSPRAGN